MSVVLILLSLVALFAGIFGWLWLCAGVRGSGWRRVLGIAALQVSGLCLAYGVLRGQPMAGVFRALFPPLALADVAGLVEYPQLLAALVWPVAPWAVAVLVVALALRPLRLWAPGLALLAALVGGVVLGDQVSVKAMCLAAVGRGFEQVQRTGFAESLARGREVPGALHGFAEVGGQRLGWSYRRMDWYVVPKDSVVVVPETAVTCPG